VTTGISVIALKGLHIITRGNAPGLIRSRIFNPPSPSLHPSNPMGAGRVREVINGVFSARGVAPGYTIKPFQGYTTRQ
jgi:hypothetical protein